MRLSMLPLSISVHVLVVVAVLIVPITAEDEWPDPAPLHGLVIATKVVPVPESIAATVPVARTAPSLPNVIAPTTLETPRDLPAQPLGQVIPDLPSGGTGPIDPGLLGPGIPTPGPPVPPSPPPTATQAPIFRIGQGVREPKRIAGGTPEYPPIARSARVQGVVVLEAVINERGMVERVKILRSVALLDAAAIAAVKEWRYTPTLLNGAPVSVLLTITINFTLQTPQP